MKLFKCTNCGQLLYFENSLCECCKHELGFVHTDLTLYTLDKDKNGQYSLSEGKKSMIGGWMSRKKPTFKYCKNHEFGVCNWLLPAGDSKIYCKACELNHIVPNLADPENLNQWRRIENAKHRLVYSILQLKLPLVSKQEDIQNGLSFDFLTDFSPNQTFLTGHEQGLVTINVSEAADDKREAIRKQMGETYRTLLGHFRHEVGHYYWDRLIAGSSFIDEYRELFGDEQVDYNTALQQYYNTGAPADWTLNYISAYASSHPWEDWAETWAHYLHIMDTLETAEAFGIKVAPGIADKSSKLNAAITVSPYQQKNFTHLLNLWLPLTFAMNSLNRSMGNADLYPFVIQPKVVDKLAFIHKVCYTSRAVS